MQPCKATSAEEFSVWRRDQEAAIARQAHYFAIRGETAIRQAGYTSVSHFLRESWLALENASKAWEKANPKL